MVLPVGEKRGENMNKTCGHFVEMMKGECILVDKYATINSPVCESELHIEKQK